MKTKKHFTSAITNEEHLKRVQETYSNEVSPFLKGNKKAYDEYRSKNEKLILTSAQKATIKCQSPT